MTLEEFQADLRGGIPATLPPKPEYDTTVNHAPKRKHILTHEQEKLALRNALRYFPAELHPQLAPEFVDELHRYGRIYMYRYRPSYPMYARSIDQYPAHSRQAAAIMMMIQNNLDPRVAQHPHELITYGGNGAVFQNWAQYRLVMKYLSEMTDEQTLVMYSGHPLGLFPSHRDAPRVVVTNGMVIPNYSKPDDWERMNALGVSQYGQMTAGSYMYIGPQGIVHGTTITVLNAGRRRLAKGQTSLGGMLFVSAGLGGMSGAQPKAGNIAGVVSVIAEINPQAVSKRHEQGWVDEVFTDLDALLARVNKARADKQAVSIAYQGNIVDLWEYLADHNVSVDLGSDQTSLHNPWAGGYYPVGVSFDDAKRMMADEPERFHDLVQESLRRQVAAINRLTARGMYFFDYGNAFLLESSRAGADIMAADDSALLRIILNQLELNLSILILLQILLIGIGDLADGDKYANPVYHSTQATAHDLGNLGCENGLVLHSLLQNLAASLYLQLTAGQDHLTLTVIYLYHLCLNGISYLYQVSQICIGIIGVLVSGNNTIGLVTDINNNLICLYIKDFTRYNLSRPYSL